MERKETKRAARGSREARNGEQRDDDDRVNSVKREGAISDEDIESKRTAHGGALCRRGTGAARLAVWVMYWHMYVIVAICRESERRRTRRRRRRKSGWQTEKGDGP